MKRHTHDKCFPDCPSYRRVVAYTSCPDCNSWSVGVLGSGRIVRHSRDFESVERVRPGSPKRATPICPGSGKRSNVGRAAPQGETE